MSATSTKSMEMTQPAPAPWTVLPAMRPLIVFVVELTIEPTTNKILPNNTTGFLHKAVSVNVAYPESKKMLPAKDVRELSI